MLAPETLIKVQLVTIAEPLDCPSIHDGNYLECATCGQCFDDGAPAYTLGGYGTVYLHLGCI